MDSIANFSHLLFFFFFWGSALLIFPLIRFINWFSLFSLQIEKARVVQTMLFVSGLNTFMQSLFGTRLPSVVVGSYTYVIPTTSIILASRYKATTDPHEVRPLT